MIQTLKRTLLRWVRFNFIGTIGVVVQFLILNAFTHFFHFNYFIANLIAVQSSLVHNFIWHQKWTWVESATDNKRQSLMRFARFNSTVGVVSIAGNIGVTWLLVHAIQMPYVVCNLLAIGICNVLNFVFARNFVFRLSPEMA